MKQQTTFKSWLAVFILTLTLAVSAFAQNIAVNGVVNDEAGLPLPGATVRVEGSGAGTTTDLDGKFRISVPSTANLLISFTGYASQRVAVSGQSSINVSLQPDARAVQEVTVTALGIQREKKALGYSAQNVSGDASTLARDVNVANTLSGKVAGLQVLSAPGGLGASSRIIIRGNNSIGRNNQPLIVVDGVPINNFNTNGASEWGGYDRGSGIGDVNPDDIESFSILKGPEATALYGVQGGNGAILISTKQGRARRGIGVQINSNFTVENALFLPEVQNQYAQGSGGVFDLKSGGAWGPKIEGQQVEDWRNPGQNTSLTAYSNRFDDFLQTGNTFSNSIALNGGNDKTSFYASYSNVNAEGILPSNTLDKHIANLRVGHQLNDWISFDAKISYINNEGQNRPRLSGDPENAYGSVLYLPPNVNVTDLDPGYDELRRLRIWNPGGSNVIQNPYWTLDLNRTRDIRDRFITLVSTNLKFTNWLSLQLRHSMDYFSDFNESRLAYGQRYGEFTGNYSQERLSSRTTNMDALLTGYKRFGNFGAKISLGANRFDLNNSGISGSNNGNLVVDFYNLGVGLNDRRSLGNSIGRKRINSSYALGSFDYNNWLYFEGSYRTDWSSTLPEANRQFSYPSVSASVVLSELFSMPEALSFLKLRGAVAQAGNDVDPYELEPTYSLGSGAGAIVTSVPTTIYESDLKPELIKSKEVGLEARLWGNRVGLEFSLYQKNATNQRIYLPVPPGSGFANRIINGGDIQNAGYELVLNLTPVKTSAFRWDLDFNMARNRNKIVELDPEAKRYLLYGPRAVFLVADEGELYGDIYGRALLRDSVSGKVIIDKDGLPKLTDTKTSFLGNVQPKWIGGINNTLTYKNVSLSFLLDIRQGGVIYSETMSGLAASGLDPSTIANREGGLVVEGITETGDANTKEVTAQQYWQRVAGADNAAEPFVYDASNVMMREMILTYRFPNSWMKNSPIRDLGVSLVGRNLFLISKNSDTPAFILDSSFSTGNDVGMESGSLPRPRSFGVNLRANF